MKRRQFRAILLQAYTKNKEKLEHGANFKILTKVRIYKEEKSKQLNNFMPCLQYTKNKEKLEQGANFKMENFNRNNVNL